MFGESVSCNEYANSYTDANTNAVRKGLMMKRLMIVMMLGLLWRAPASATDIPIDVAGCVPLTSAGANFQLLDATAGNRQIFASVHATASTTGVACRFWWPSTNPSALTGVVVAYTMASATSGNTKWSVRIGCAGSNVEWQNVTYGTAVVVDNSAVVGTATRASYATIGAVTPAGNAASVLCSIELSRMNATSSEAAGNAFLNGFVAQY